MTMDKKEFPKRGQLRLPSYDYANPGAYFITVCTRIREQDILGRVVAAVGDGLCAVPPDGLCAVPPDSFPCPAPPAAVRLTEIGQIVDKAIRDIPALYTDVSVDTYCVMPDHIHLLVVLKAGRDRARPLPDIIGRMKSYTDRRYRLLGAPFGPGLWQRSYYDHVIRNEYDLRNTREYILNNPQKWIQDKEP